MTQQHHFVPNPSDRDWTEDFSHENGNYSNNCIECKQQFNGHKRRVICKKCATPNWVELAKRKPPEDTKDNKAWAGAWLEGEMVGYAKCMVEKVLPVLAPSEEVKQQKSELKETMSKIEQEYYHDYDDAWYSADGLKFSKMRNVAILTPSEEVRPRKKIELGEIFEVDGKCYMFSNPTTASQRPNTDHGHILHEINFLE